VIVIPAFDPAANAPEMVALNVTGIIRKPFDMGELAERVTAVLGERV
jgi:hypothetical protein